MALSASRAASRNGQKDCWPATVRDWLTAQCAVRLGRLDRYPWVSKTRLSLAHHIGRSQSSIRFATPYGFTMLLPCSYKGLITMALGGEGFHPKLRQALEETIRPGDVVIDGGSHVGFFSLLAARLLQGKGHVFSFEPDPQTFALLRLNVEENGFLRVIQLEEKALTSANGSFDFFPSPQESMRSSLVERSDPHGRTIRVAGVRLDDYLARVGQNRVDVIKLDLEGAEPLALGGMSASLETARLLILEVNIPLLARLGVDPLTLVNRTAETGCFETVVFADEREESFRKWNDDLFLQLSRDHDMLNVLCAKPAVMRFC